MVITVDILEAEAVVAYSDPIVRVPVVEMVLTQV
jgi:hypothetical protein